MSFSFFPSFVIIIYLLISGIRRRNCVSFNFFFALFLLQTDSMTIFRCVFVSRCVSLSSDCPVGLLFPFICFGTLYSFFFLRFRRNRPEASIGESSVSFFFLSVLGKPETHNKHNSSVVFFSREDLFFIIFLFLSKILRVQTTLAIFFSASLSFNDCPFGPCTGLFYFSYSIRQSVLSFKHIFFW